MRLRRRRPLRQQCATRWVPNHPLSVTSTVGEAAMRAVVASDGCVLPCSRVHQSSGAALAHRASTASRRGWPKRSAARFATPSSNVRATARRTTTCRWSTRTSGAAASTTPQCWARPITSGTSSASTRVRAAPTRAPSPHTAAHSARAWSPWPHGAGSHAYTAVSLPLVHRADRRGVGQGQGRGRRVV
jgi:hypothetical protein